MQNPLQMYRRTQRDLRRNFESFTLANCPTCPTPCCRQPARIAPTDIMLAEATGWRAALVIAAIGNETEARKQETQNQTDAGSADMVTTTAARMLEALSNPTNGNEAILPIASLNSAINSDGEESERDLNASLPCEFLGTRGCTFPHDLRPLGCTTYICPYMIASMDRTNLTRVKRLVRELEDRHMELMSTLLHIKQI